MCMMQIKQGISLRLGINEPELVPIYVPCNVRSYVGNLRCLTQHV